MLTGRNDYLDKNRYELEIGGRILSIETGELAKQANGAVLVQYGETVVLVTAVASREPREGVDFFPLRVDFEERQYAAGRIPGSFFRREGRPSERAILNGRLLDRPIRPLFPPHFRNDVQIVATVLSYDGKNLPELCGIVGASAALTISDIPFEGPIAGVQVGMIQGEFVVNPPADMLSSSDLELVVAGTRDGIIMVEAGANELPEEKILEAINFGHQHVKRLVAWQDEIAAQIAKPKMDVPVIEIDDELVRLVEDLAPVRIREALLTEEKLDREAALEAVKDDIIAQITESMPEVDPSQVASLLSDIEKRVMRAAILQENRRPDGRKTDEIRPITCRVGLLPRTHGSGLFTRGQTQVLTVAALGALGDRQFVDGLGDAEDTKRYLHHYNFPPFSTGEVRPIRSPGRREIGHGALAERALVRMIPPEESFPYTIRLVSEVLESNGSTSMASVCGSTLALMDAGVPLKAPVAGIAMGLIKEGDRVAVLSDIQGVEDFLGDMDFKIAGTEKGITAIQMDLKIAGITTDLLHQALEQARKGRLHILNKMLEVMPSSRQDLSPFAPRIITMHIHPDKIRDVIGPGGKTINRIIADTGVKIDIEDDGRVYISAENAEAGQAAAETIRQLVKDPEKGEIYLGKVVRITNFGAFVELMPGKDGLVHISQLANERVNKVEDVVSIGDRILVMVREIDELGRINLSRKDAIKSDPEGVLRETRQQLVK